MPGFGESARPGRGEWFPPFPSSCFRPVAVPLPSSSCEALRLMLREMPAEAKPSCSFHLPLPAAAETLDVVDDDQDNHTQEGVT